jgi:hypothetical protein
MLFSQTIDNIDSEITALLAQVEVAKQRQTQLIELDALTDHTLEGLADVVSKIQCNAPDAICASQQRFAIASLKSAVLGLFGNDGNDGGNQPTDPTPDTDPDEPELLCLNGETGDCLTTADLDDEGEANQPLTYTQAIKNRCGACWGYEVTTKADIKAGFINRTNLNFMEAVNLERTGKEFYQTVEAYLDRLYYNGQACELASLLELDKPLVAGSRFWFGAPDNTGTVLESVGNGEYKVQIDGAVGEVTLERHHCHYFLEPLTGQTGDTDKAPLTGQHCTITFSSPDSAGESMAYCEFVKVGDRVGYIRVNTTGEIIATYAGFNNKSRAKSWANYLETMTSRIELRAAKRLGNWKHELKMSGLSMKQIERLAAENLDKMPPNKEPSLPPSYKPQPIPQPVNPDEVEPGDIVVALLSPSASYRVEQVMPNGILDCENLTSGDRLGLRPGAVSLVQKAEKSQNPNAQTTTGNYLGLSKQRELVTVGES